MQTLSEQLFEKMCEFRNVSWERIPEISGMRTPDHRVFLKGVEVIAEIKQIQFKKEDLNALEGLKSNRAVSFFPKVKVRIRHLINDAYPQLKNFTEGKPGILILFDYTMGFTGLNDETILNAMYGDEVFAFSVPDDPKIEGKIIDHKFGRNRTTTPNRHRSLSAIGLLEQVQQTDQINLKLFHNIFADNPLDFDIAWQLANKQFTLPNNSSDYEYWIEIIKPT